MAKLRKSAKQESQRKQRPRFQGIAARGLQQTSVLKGRVALTSCGCEKNAKNKGHAVEDDPRRRSTKKKKGNIQEPKVERSHHFTAALKSSKLAAACALACLRTAELIFFFSFKILNSMIKEIPHCYPYLIYLYPLHYSPQLLKSLYAA